MTKEGTEYYKDKLTLATWLSGGWLNLELKGIRGIKAMIYMTGEVGDNRVHSLKIYKTSRDQYVVYKSKKYSLLNDFKWISPEIKYLNIGEY